MTAKDLIKALQNLGSENLNREVIMFDCNSYFTPYKVEVIQDNKGWSENIVGKILID